MESAWRMRPFYELIMGTSLVWILAVQAQLVAMPAQDGADRGAAVDGAEGEDIVVTGFRASQRWAAKAKRDAAVILDAVSQDDLACILTVVTDTVTEIFHYDRDTGALLSPVTVPVPVPVPPPSVFRQGASEGE